MQLISADPRSLKENPYRSRRSRTTPQSDALLCASIKAVGVVQPPVVRADPEGGNSYIIVFGHRRAAQSIAAELAEIPLLLADPADDLGAMQSLAENIAREPLNPVDQWRAIERLVALDWTEESIALALALGVRQIRKLRLLANILPAMLEQMARGDMPNEQQLRTIAAAGQEEQAEVWKKHKPKKQEQAAWWDLARALTKTRMLAKDASFGDELAQAYGITWEEDLFAPADQDGRFTTNVEAFLGAQQEWLAGNLPKRGAVIEVNDWGQPKLPAKASQVYGKPGKGDNTGWYINPRDGSVQSVAYRLPETKKAKPADVKGGEGEATSGVEAPKQRPNVTQKGLDMIGDLRTDALHEALARAPIEEDTLMALLILGFAGTNVSVASGSSDNPYAHANGRKHAARLIGDDGKFAFDRETLQQVARGLLIDVMSCRRNRSDSGIAARIAGDAIGADAFLANTATEDFLSCLSRNALEAAAEVAGVPARIKVKDTRSALVEHFSEGRFVHAASLMAPPADEVSAWVSKHAAHAGVSDDEAEDGTDSPVEELCDEAVGTDEGTDAPDDQDEAVNEFREAAE